MNISSYEDYLEIVKKNYGKMPPRLNPKSWLSQPLYCRRCGLEGCNVANHLGYSYDEEQRAMGGNQY